jgi:HEAT repeats
VFGEPSTEVTLPVFDRPPKLLISMCVSLLSPAGRQEPPKSASEAGSQPARHFALSRKIRPLVVLAAITGAILIAVLRGNADSHRIVSPDSENSLNAFEEVPSSTFGIAPSSRQLDRMKPQKQAVTLLALAVAHADGAVSKISSRLDRWQGRLTWDSEMAALTNAALHSTDMQVRQSGIQVELAAYGLSRNSASLQYLLRSVESVDHAKKIWALWSLGLMGNSGVETARVMQVLTAYLKDADEDSRRWAVEGIAQVGASEAIPLLLAAMHDDSSAIVREAAACGLAQAGMFTDEQRAAAIPQLLNYTDDPSLDTQTHDWAFQALADITRQSLPNDARVWRSWYENQGLGTRD